MWHQSCGRRGQALLLLWKLLWLFLLIPLTHSFIRDVPPTQVFRVPPAIFAALFLYCEEITGKAEGGGDPDQLYTVLTTAQRAAVTTTPPHPGQQAALSVLKALEPVMATMQYFESDLLDAVNPEVDVLFRGAGHEVPLEDIDGRAITTHAWHCFTSASLSATAALAFLKPGGTLFVLRSARAKAIFFLSAFIKELECLVPPTVFLIRDALPIAILRMMNVQASPRPSGSA